MSYQIVENAVRNGLKCAGDDNTYTAIKVLIRMSAGSKTKAMKIAKDVAQQYIKREDEYLLDNDLLFTEAFDNVCAELNGEGTELEWPED